MRLTEQQLTAIKSAICEITGSESRVWLFGSRVDDSKRGGDIDLLIESDEVIPNLVELLCKLEARLVRSLGDQKLDLLLKDANTHDSPITEAARKGGILL